MDPESEPPLSTLERLWKQRGFDRAELPTDADGTLLPSERQQLASSQTLVDEVDAEALAFTTNPEPFVFGEVIGKGGNAEVRDGFQPSLRRQVALKSALDTESRGARATLLKEAWVGGALEHPNIVPVHALAGRDGMPALAMKRVAGQNWSELIANPVGHQRISSSDPLEGHLGVFLEVIDAVRFAHSRGILHLDIKPDNVMIGEFGEVYVLDWGLAAAIEGRGPDWLRSAASLEGIAGTPGYMAPELASGQNSRIDERTDVYLLGATLHHIVTGQALHAGGGVLEQLTRAYHSKPVIHGEAVPGGLSNIVLRATARRPEERFQNVAELRSAVVHYQERRRAESFLDEAAKQLERIEWLIADAAADTDIGPRLAECEFALEQARRIWAEHPDLPRLAARVALPRFRLAVARETVDAARAALDSLPQPVPELEAEFLELERRVRERHRYEQKLERIERELDLTLGSRDRRQVFISLGAIWCAVNVSYGFWTRVYGGEVSYGFLLFAGGVGAVFLGPYGWLRRRVFFRNRANQRLFGGLILTALLVQVFWVAAWISGLKSAHAIALTPLFYTFTWASLALVLDRRILYGAGIFLLAAVLTAAMPVWKFEIIGISGLLAVSTTVWIWREPRSPS